MKFVVDDMLGKLAKRLRMLGFDTLYEVGTPDRELLKISREQGRILLTRDTALLKIRGVNGLFVRSTKYKEQVKQVIKDLKLKVEKDKIFSRCAECNAEIKEIEKLKVKDKVPEYTFKTHEKFYICPGCKRVYWKGTHLDKLNKEFKEVL